MSCVIILSQLRAFFSFLYDVQCQFVDVSLKHLEQLAQFIIHLSGFRLNSIAKQLVVDVEDKKLCRASKPLKSVAFSNSANVSIGYIYGQVGCLMFICFLLQFIESEGLKAI